MRVTASRRSPGSIISELAPRSDVLWSDDVRLGFAPCATMTRSTNMFLSHACPHQSSECVRWVCHGTDMRMSIHAYTMRSVSHFHNSAASKKKKKKKPPLQLLSSGQRAPHSFGAESPSHSGAQQRGLAPSWCRRLRRKSDSDDFALVRLHFIAATAACGRQPPACRPTRFTSSSMRARPLSHLPSGVSRLLKRPSVGLRRSCARPPTLPPASPFVPAENPACCHAHPFRSLQGLIPCRSPLHGHADDVKCEVAPQCSLA